MKKFTIKAFELLTADNQMIDFGETINAPEQIDIGTPGKVKGKPCEGEYLMPDGRKLVFKDGKVKKILPAPALDAIRNDIVGIKAMLRDIQTEIKGLSRTPFKKVEKKTSGSRKPFQK